MSESGLRHITERLFKMAEITKPCNIHHFRHSAITHAAGLNMSETQLSYRFWGIPHSAMLSVYIHLNEQLKSSGYRDAKGMGEGNGKTVINPLASRCVECGRLIQSGSLCKTCTDSKKLSKENEALKAQMETTQKDMTEIKKMLASYQDVTKIIAGGKMKLILNDDAEPALEIVQNDIEKQAQKAEEEDKKQILKELQKRDESISLVDMQNEVKNLQK
jgi:hypothetical protein